MKKNITLFTISLSKGGAETQMVKLSIFLAKQGHNVAVLYLLPTNDFKDQLEEQNVLFKHIPIKKGLGVFSIIKYIKSNSTDILISFMFGANIIARFVKMCTSVKLVTSVRNNEIAKRYSLLYKLTYKLDNASTFNSIVSLNKFKSEGLSIPERSFLMNNAISIPDTVVEKEKAEVFTFISIAHFRPQKDYVSLFKAIRILKDKNIKVKLYVLGNLNNAIWPFELLKEHCIEGQVDILGFCSNPKEYVLQSDAVVLSTFWEGTPNAVLEGMSEKKPIVATAVPGCIELLSESQCGFLSEKNNAVDLSEKMEKLINLSDNERSILGNNGYEFVKNNYDEKSVYKKWEDLINNLED
ncbi:glycosyltransferase [Flavicella sediminum]|uniref:glycosyltransferase n=1 Tax=Flavicella sediminum TaxID=2585141 RepID=UPI00111F99BA|nr:glycosyltransferase [Flavicella sediminum]